LAWQLQEVREEQAAIKENIKKKEMEDQKQLELLEQGTSEHNNVVEERENLTQQLQNLLQQRTAQQDNISELKSDRQ
jgi:hypothetical protein